MAFCWSLDKSILFNLCLVAACISCCKATNCFYPGKPTNGAISPAPSDQYGHYVPGTMVQFTCNTGYTLVGQGMMFCIANGQWFGSLPCCTKIQCEVPRAPTNGKVKYDHRSPGGALNYTCNAGYKMVGSETANCTNNGTWDPKPEKTKCYACDKNQYGGGGTKRSCDSCPRHSETVTTANTIKSSCVCDYGYKMTNGRCRAIRCPMMSPPAHGTMSRCGNRVGSMCYFTCQDGYFLDRGSTPIKCQLDGNWDGRKAVCKKCPSGSYKAGERFCLNCPTNTNIPGCKAATTNACSPNKGRGPCNDTCIPRGTTGYSCECETPGFQLATDRKGCVQEKSCSVPPMPQNGGAVCVRNKKENSMLCALMCNNKYEFVSRINNFEKCGPTTGWVWHLGEKVPPCIEEFLPGLHIESDESYFEGRCAFLWPEQKTEAKYGHFDALEQFRVPLDQLSIHCGTTI